MVFFKANKCEDEKKPKLQTQLFNIIHRIFTYKTSDLPWMKDNNTDQSLSTREIKKRMAGISIYKVCDAPSEEDFCLFSDDGRKRGIELNFISKQDAHDYMHATKRWGNIYRDCQIYDIPLSDLVSYEGGEIPIRLVPESSQVKIAMQEKKKDMVGSGHDEIVSGVPVFQMDGAALHTSTGEKYRPAFLRKEDLQRFMSGAIGEPSPIQVSTLEDIVQEMKDSSTSKLNDVLFVGPGITSFTWLREHEYN